MSTKKDLASGESGSGRVDKRVRVRVRKDGVKAKGAKGAKKTRVRSEKNLEKRNVKKWGKPKKYNKKGRIRGWRLIISSLKVMLCNQSILILNNSRSLIWDGGGYLWWACWSLFLPKTFRGRGRNPYSSYPRVVLMLLEYHPTRKLHHCPIYWYINVVNHVELVDWPCTRDSNGSVIECSRPTHSSLYGWWRYLIASCHWLYIEISLSSASCSLLSVDFLSIEI